MASNPSQFAGVVPASAISGQVPVASGGTGAATALAAATNLGFGALQAATPNAGFALQNATPTLISWTTPNDGNKHMVTIVSWLQVTVTETGGAVAFNYTAPDGSAQAANMYPGGAAAPSTGVFAAQRLVNPNTVVSVAQSSALTAGAATVWAQIWGV